MKKLITIIICIISTLFIVTGCDYRDSEQQYIKNYKSFFDYTFHNNWSYTMEDNSSYSDMWGTTYYSTYTINYVDSKKRKRVFSFDTVDGQNKRDFELARDVVSAMEDIIEDDMTEIIQKYVVDYQNSMILRFRSTTYPYGDEYHNYDFEIAKKYSQWILNTHNGVKLYHVYDFIKNNASQNDSIIDIDVYFRGEEIYQEINSNRDRIIQDFKKLVGNEIEVEFNLLHS